MVTLIIGDIVGKCGIEFLKQHLQKFKKHYNVDFCIANGENSASNGITPIFAKEILSAGVDVITMGNHTFDKYNEGVETLSSTLPVIRPLNYPAGTPGEGYIIIETDGISIAVINAMGRIFLDTIDCPFRGIDAVLRRIEGQAQLIFVDLHAEATSEKLAFAHHLDGRVTTLFGTHTHVQTADENITPKGMAYISDVGMTGPIDSILGKNKDQILSRFVTRLNTRAETVDGAVQMCGIIVEADENTGKAVNIQRICIS